MKTIRVLGGAAAIALLFLAGCGGGSGGASRADIQKGHELYLSYGCGVCHGKDGAGDGPVGATTRKKPRDFHDGSSFTNGHSVKAIAATISTGIDEGRTGMIGFPQIPWGEREKIAEYIMSLDGKR